MSSMVGKFGPAVDSLTRHTSAQVPVGTINHADDGDYVYIGAGGSIPASGDPVSCVGALSACVLGDLDLGVFVGAADAPFASGEYGWVRKSGLVTGGMVVESGAAAGVGVQLSATAGKLKAITTSGQQIGVMTEASDNAGTARKGVYLCGN